MKEIDEKGIELLEAAAAYCTQNGADVLAERLRETLSSLRRGDKKTNEDRHTPE